MKTIKPIFKQLLAVSGITLLLAAIPAKVQAQQDPMVSQYMFSGHFVNPGYAGSHSYANLTLLARRQWMGFEGAPLSSYLSFDMPLANKRLGVGAIVSNDQIGVTNQTRLAGTVAYHLPVGEKAKLAVGLRASVSYYRAQLTDLVVWDQNDQVFSNNINGKTLPNAGAGIYFYMPRFYAGVSVPEVITYNPDLTLHVNMNQAPLLERHYYFATGVAIPLGSNFDLKPSVLVKYVQHAPVEADANLSLFIHKMIWVGATWRTNDGMSGMVEYQATKNLRVGYAYDLALTNMQKYNQGSHEIMIAWDFVHDETLRFKSPRFF